MRDTTMECDMCHRIVHEDCVAIVGERIVCDSCRDWRRRSAFELALLRGRSQINNNTTKGERQ